MNSKQVKDIRKQLRNVVQEMLPGVTSQEMYVQLSKVINERLDQISKHINSTLETIDQRSKDVQTYVIRQSAQNQPVPQPVESKNDKS